MFTKPESTLIDTIDPGEIAEVIDTLAARIRRDSNADLYGPWLLARAAAALGINVIQTSSSRPVEVVRDLGTDWASMIVETNREHPEDAHRVLLAAGQVFKAIQRGMQPTT